MACALPPVAVPMPGAPGTVAGVTLFDGADPNSVRDFFDSEARSMQQGGAEYVYAKQWLGIYWPADEYMLIKLTAEAKLQKFYEEAEPLLMGLLEAAAADRPWLFQRRARLVAARRVHALLFCCRASAMAF